MKGLCMDLTYYVIFTFTILHVILLQFVCFDGNSLEYCSFINEQLQEQMSNIVINSVVTRN